MAGEGYERRLYALRDHLEEEFEKAMEKAMGDITSELSEIVGQIYDEYPKDYGDSDENYYRAEGVRIACYLFAKGFGIDPESIRKGMGEGE